MKKKELNSVSTLFVSFMFLVSVASAEIDLTSNQKSSLNSDQLFQNIRKEFISVYAEKVKNEANLNLEIKLSEETPNYFGGMKIEGDSLVIVIGSEAHKEKAVTPFSYLALLCHEVGHRLGGAPFKNDSENPWSSTEGQSDYYASSVCLPYFFEHSKILNEKIPTVDHKLVEICKQRSTREMDICLQTIQSGQDMVDSIHAIYLDYPNPPPRPNVLNPEPIDGSKGFMYPSMQCRLDTFVHGALGLARPNCWYNP